MYTGNPLTGTLAKSEDPDEMQYQGLHFGGIKTTRTEINHNVENSVCDPLKYTMGNSIIIVSIPMGKSIRIQMVNFRLLTKTAISACEAPPIILGTKLLCPGASNIVKCLFSVSK